MAWTEAKPPTRQGSPSSWSASVSLPTFNHNQGVCSKRLACHGIKFLTFQTMSNHVAGAFIFCYFPSCFFPQFDLPPRYNVRLRPTLWPGTPLDRCGPVVPPADASIDITMVKMVRCQHHKILGRISNDFSTWWCESGNDNETIWKDTFSFLLIICHLSMQPSLSFRWVFLKSESTEHHVATMPFDLVWPHWKLWLTRGHGKFSESSTRPQGQQQARHMALLHWLEQRNSVWIQLSISILYRVFRWNKRYIYYISICAFTV